MYRLNIYSHALSSSLGTSAELETEIQFKPNPFKPNGFDSKYPPTPRNLRISMRYFDHHFRNTGGNVLIY